ncbi:hypothetical protein OG308_24310 [Nocardia salmonicida]|uniref:EthD domain-containing protein n=1 Tax=Nocardia salmonicida TaxID=53431 RepID=A0ABZ1N3D1_9NOCA
MEQGILYVTTRPTSPKQEDEYNEWYDLHLREVCAVPGFIGARRFAPMQDDGPYVAVYDMEAEDLAVALAGLYAAAENGDIQLSDALQLDPPPTIRLLKLCATHRTR